MYYYFQKKVVKTERGAFYYLESSGFRRYINPLDVITRLPQIILPQLPKEINDIVWHYKSQLECARSRWFHFIMSLTLNQYICFNNRKKGKYVRPSSSLKFALNNFDVSSRIYKKAFRQLLNY